MVSDTTDQQAVTVAQIDMNMAEEWRDILCHRDSEFPGDPVFALAEDFARHRLASVSSASAGTKKLNGFRCHNCKEIYWSTVTRAPDRCGVCQCRDFAAVYPSSADPAEPVPATNQAGEVTKAYTAGFEQGWEWPRETSPTEAAERYARGYVAALSTQPATSQEGECNCGCAGDPFICIEADGTDRAASQEGEGLPGGMVSYKPSHPDWNHAPEDWDRTKPVLLEGHVEPSMVKSWRGSMGDRAIVAYTPLAATPTPPTLSEDLREAEVERFINAGFATVSRNPSDHETAVAYREAVRLALAHSGSRS